MVSLFFGREYEQVKQIINYFDKKKIKLIIAFFQIHIYNSKIK